MPDFAVTTAFRGTDKISPVFNRMGNAADKFGNRASHALERTSFAMSLIKKAAPFVSIYALGRGFMSLVSNAQKIEDVTAAFTPLMGGVEKAEQLVNRLNKEAATTPYQFEAISKSAKQLLPVMAGDIDKVANTFRMLGDTAGGNAEKLDSITRGFTKAMLKGKVDMESLNMIGEAGVPIFTELANSMNTKVSPAFFKMISAGKVTTDDLTKAFQKMTSEGGIFYKGMEISSLTLSGKLSTLRDKIALAAAAIGKKLLPYIKKAVDVAIMFADNISVVIDFLPKLIPIIKFIALGFASYGVALLLVTGYQKVMIAMGWIKYLWMMKAAIIKAVAATNGWAIAQKALNFVLSANPIGLVTIAVMALGYAIYDLYKNWDKYVLQFQIGVQDWIIKWKTLKTVVLDVMSAMGMADRRAFEKSKLELQIAYLEGEILKKKQKNLNTEKNLDQQELNQKDKTINDLMKKNTQTDKKAGMIAARATMVRQAVNQALGTQPISQLAIAAMNRQAQREYQNRGFRFSAPNESEAQSRGINFNGQLNIAGAPEGSTVTGETRGAKPIKMQLVGAQ